MAVARPSQKSTPRTSSFSGRLPRPEAKSSMIFPKMMRSIRLSSYASSADNKETMINPLWGFRNFQRMRKPGACFTIAL